jgi:hypothetical protein
MNTRLTLILELDAASRKMIRIASPLCYLPSGSKEEYAQMGLTKAEVAEFSASLERHRHRIDDKTFSLFEAMKGATEGYLRRLPVPASARPGTGFYEGHVEKAYQLGVALFDRTLPELQKKVEKRIRRLERWGRFA